MPSFDAVTASNRSYRPASPPVALVLGGTAGIGRGLASTLARVTNGNIHLILLGRNAASAEEIFASLPHSDSTKYEFEKVDGTSMADVRRVTASLKARLTKINFIVACAGGAIFDVKPTPEGHIPLLALIFLARFKFFQDLLPLVEQTERSGERVGVLDIGAAGLGGKVDLDDLSCQKRSLLQLVKTGRPSLGTYHDAMLEEFSRRYPTIHFVHTFPGFVSTNLLGRGFGFVARTLRLGTTIDDYGQYGLYPILSTEEKYKKGVTRVNERVVDVPPSPGMTEEVIQKVWEYSVEGTKDPNE